MSKRLVFALVMTALTLLGLSACTPCDMVAPNLLIPADGTRSEVPFPFVLEWNYTDSCPIDNFEIHITKDPAFTENVYTYLADGSETSYLNWYPSYNNEYFWKVRAVDEGVTGPFSAVSSFIASPICISYYLEEPILTNPSFGAIFDDSSENLEWDWPPTNCAPESYSVELSMGSPSFTDSTYSGATGSLHTNWSGGTPLPAATQFWWRVTPFSDGVDGPTSATGMFWTGPACVASSLVAPYPATPQDNELISDPLPIFTWSYPQNNCTPEGHRLRVSKTPDMSEIIFDANSPSIAASELVSWSTLDDCGEYYWQISAISQGIEGPASPVQRFVVDTAGNCGCDPAALPIPELYSPDQHEIVPDVHPTLRWLNPELCLPEVYVIRLNEIHDFSGPDLGGAGNSPGFNAWAPAADLERATQYWWKVFSGAGTEMGEYSSPSTFFTGPACTSHAELTEPQLIYPAPGEDIDTLVPMFHFVPGDPACVPGGYLVHLHTLPDLSDPNLLGEISVPSTYVVPANQLVDCSVYYWNVTPVHNADYGPTSPTWSFSTNASGACIQDNTCQMNMGKDACNEAGGSYEQTTRTGEWNCVCP